MIRPADARAIAPVVRFAVLLKRGNDEDEDEEECIALLLDFGSASTNPMLLDDVRKLDLLATCCRSAFRLEK